MNNSVIITSCVGVRAGISRAVVCKNPIFYLVLQEPFTLNFLPSFHLALSFSFLGLVGPLRLPLTAAASASAALLMPRPPSGTSSHVSFPTNCPLPTFHRPLVHTTACPRPHHKVRRYLCRLRPSIPRKYICIPLPSSLHQILSTASCQLQLLLLRPLLSP